MRFVLAAVAALPLFGCSVTGSEPTPIPTPPPADATCPQPSANGCQLTAGQPVQASLTRAEDVHSWLLDVPAGAAVQLTLSNLSADLRLYAYGPGRTLAGQSNVDGLADENIELRQAEGGRYLVYVDSPRGATTTGPYRLLATLTGGSAGTVVPERTAATGTTLFGENFASVGLLTNSSLRPQQYRQGYVAGEYEISILDSANSTTQVAYIPGTFTDATIAVDVRVASAPGSQSVLLGCREQPGDNQGEYRFFANPETRTFRLYRFEAGGRAVNLAALQPSDAILRGNAVNHVELTCVGRAITGSINGKEVISVQDGTYTTGRTWFGIGAASSVGELRFKSVRVSSASARTAPPTPPRSPGTILLSDDFSDPQNGWLLRTSSDPGLFQGGYVDGAYEIRVLSVEDRFIRGVYLPGVQADATIAVDVRPLGNVPTHRAMLDCREQPGDDSGSYRFYVDLEAGSVMVRRLSASGDGTTLYEQPSPAIRKGAQQNRIELSCVGSKIIGTVNGTVVATVDDATYHEGSWGLWSGDARRVGGLSFDNLVLTQR